MYNTDEDNMYIYIKAVTGKYITITTSYSIILYKTFLYLVYILIRIEFIIIFVNLTNTCNNNKICSNNYLKMNTYANIYTNTIENIYI